MQPCRKSLTLRIILLVGKSRRVIQDHNTKLKTEFEEAGQDKEDFKNIHSNYRKQSKG